MFERVDQAHIKRAFQTGIEKRIPTGALRHELRAHILYFCMCPQFGGRFGKRRRSDFFFRLRRSSFSVILPRPTLLYISSSHICILREEDIHEMRIAPEKCTKPPFEPIIDVAIGSQMASHPTDHSHSLDMHPPFD